MPFFCSFGVISQYILHWIRDNVIQRFFSIHFLRLMLCIAIQIMIYKNRNNIKYTVIHIQKSVCLVVYNYWIFNAKHIICEVKTEWNASYAILKNISFSFALFLSLFSLLLFTRFSHNSAMQEWRKNRNFSQSL